MTYDQYVQLFLGLVGVVCASLFWLAIILNSTPKE